MHRSKLFRALVIGGSMTAAALVGCGDESAPNPAANSEQNESASTGDSQTGDSTQDGESSEAETHENATETGNDSPSESEETDPAEGTETDPADEPDPSSSEEDPAAAEGELAPCFCGTEPSCCEEVEGELQVIDGFECCWGTSC